MNRQQACVAFRQITVHSIESSSGIFIGTNQASGWRSIGKTNQGFGTLTDAVMHHAINTVFDSDTVDASFRDASFVALTETANREQQCAVDFGSIQTNALNNGSVFGIGDNKQLGWRSARKNNYGSGKNVGGNKSSYTVNFTMDNDVSDSVFHSDSRQFDRSQVTKNVRIRHRGEPDD